MLSDDDGRRTRIDGLDGGIDITILAIETYGRFPKSESDMVVGGYPYVHIHTTFVGNVYISLSLLDL